MNKNSSADFIEIMFERGFIHQVTDKQNLKKEMLTDPSYRGQILVSTYPMIGNYGIDNNFSESKRIQVKSYVVRDLCDYPFHFSNDKDLNKS